MIRKLSIVAATVAALGAAGGAGASVVTFDTNGAASGGPVIQFGNMTWQAGNGLVMGALSTAPTIVNINGVPTAAQLVRTVAQARLSSFQTVGGGNFSLPNSAEITYQADYWEYAVGVGTSTASFFLAPAPTGYTNSFQMYYDNSALLGDVKTGNNYGNNAGAVKILEGTITFNLGTYTDQTRGAFGTPTTTLDCDAFHGCPGTFPGTFNGGIGDGDQGKVTGMTNSVRTNVGNGQTQIGVDVTMQDNAFFKSDVTTLALNLSSQIGVGVPFQQTDPWKNIVNQTPYFSVVSANSSGAATNATNGADCTLGGVNMDGVRAARCDQLLQTTGVSSFITQDVPEPGSLALVGLALAGVGLAARRRQA